MTTKTEGGRITGLLALTVQAQVALNAGDAVVVTGDYEVGLATDVKPVLGHVSVANKAPVHGVATRPAQVPGDVTVEARGFYVNLTTAAGVIAAGMPVGYNATGGMVQVALGAANACGIALQAATGAGDKIDVLFR